MKTLNTTPVSARPAREAAALAGIAHMEEMHRMLKASEPKPKGRINSSNAPQSWFIGNAVKASKTNMANAHANTNCWDVHMLEVEENIAYWMPGLNIRNR